MSLVFSEAAADDNPSAVQGGSALNIIKDLKKIIDKDDKDELSSYICKLEKELEESNKLHLECVDRKELKKLIEKHPYFKNPNDYHIRLITIMKYLKKKDAYLAVPDFDLLVDEVITSMDNVKKVSDGKYKKIK